MVIVNRWIPLKGYKAVNVCGIIIAREPLSDTDLRHEAIHTRQMTEMLIIGFYVWYIAEWLVRLIIYRNAHRAYRTVSLEREAYCCERYADYRQWYGWLRFLTK